MAERLEGIRALALVGADGMVIESEATAAGLDLDLEMLSAEMVALVRAIGTNHRELEVGRVHSFHVATDRYRLLLGEVVEGNFLLLVIDPSISPGRARFELRRSSLTLGRDLLA